MDFHYHPLKADGSSIRLLRLSRWSTEDIIKCRMVHLSVTSCNYIALSYTWGPILPRHLQKHIIVNGQRLFVQDNAFSFLRRCAKWREYCLIWIDAICINQDDYDERSSQIAMMGRIYFSAKAVQMWFGSQPLDASVYLLARHHPLDDELAFLAAPTSDSWYARAIRHALSMFCKHQYWRRLWIVQEVMLATEICIL